MNLQINISNLLWKLVCLRGWRQFTKQLKDPCASQLELLKGILKKNSNSEYGEKYQFDTIHTFDDYQREVPITIYEDYEPYIKKIMNGESPNALTEEAITLLEPTSGSTSASKYIPYNRSLNKDFQKGIEPWLYDLYKHKKIPIGGTSYWSLTPLTGEKKFTESNIPIGFEEDVEYFGSFGKKLINRILTVPKEVKFISNPDTFKHVTLLFLLMDKNLSFISVWNPTFLLLLLDYLDDHYDELLNDLEKKTIRNTSGIPKEYIDLFNSRIKVSNKRYDTLKKTKPKMLLSIWPKLKVISCWDDGNSKVYAEALKERVKPIEIQGKGLLATECFISFPLVKASGSVLSIGSHFFEFISVKEYEQDTKNPKTVLLDKLNIGEQYIVVVTTSGGLYRYNIGDIVEVTGFYKSIPILEFIGKNDNVSDHYGEKLNEVHVSRLLSETFDKLQMKPQFYLLALSKSETPHYTLYIESDRTHKDLQNDIEIKLEENFHYKYCKQLGQLSNIDIVYVTNGFKKYLERYLEMGIKLGDIKQTPLSKLTGWEKYFV